MESRGILIDWDLEANFSLKIITYLMYQSCQDFQILPIYFWP